MTDLRDINARIAAAYDRVPYDPQREGYPGLDLAPVLGIAALHGDVPASDEIDILDLGCGTGAQLERLAGQTRGRLMGVDLSRSACDLAITRGARFGGRCEIVCADLAEISPASLGQFHLIHLIGVLYVTPPGLQKPLLDLVAACLRPGGIAVISYYSTGLAAVTCRLREAIRSTIDLTASPAAQIQAARARLADLVLQNPPRDRNEAIICDHLRTCDDAAFFHEMLNESFAPTPTSAIAAMFKSHDIRFLNWMPPAPLGEVATADQWPVLADRYDQTAAGYRYAVFKQGAFKRNAGAHLAGPRPVTWETQLQRLEPGTGPGQFRDTALGVMVNIRSAALAGVLDRLAAGPCGEPLLLESAGGDPAVLKRDLFGAWQNGLLTALWNPFLT